MLQKTFMCPTVSAVNTVHSGTLVHNLLYCSIFLLVHFSIYIVSCSLFLYIVSCSIFIYINVLLIIKYVLFLQGVMQSMKIKCLDRLLAKQGVPQSKISKMTEKEKIEELNIDLTTSRENVNNTNVTIMPDIEESDALNVTVMEAIEVQNDGEKTIDL